MWVRVGDLRNNTDFFFWPVQYGTDVRSPGRGTASHACTRSVSPKNTGKIKHDPTLIESLNVAYHSRLLPFEAKLRKMLLVVTP